MQIRLFVTVLSAAALLAPHALPAATKKAVPKPAAKSSPKPAISASAPALPAEAPRVPGAFMVPRAVALRPTTPVEAEANAIWNIRAALNVAALQCQFSPYLDAVKNYNSFLTHHSEELTRAQATMVAHFKRYDGAKSVNSFDQYTTKTYNSYSTLDAQYQFCDAAGRVGREVLATPKGKLGSEAIRRNPEMRASLAQQPLSPALAVNDLAPISIAQIVQPDS